MPERRQLPATPEALGNAVTCLKDLIRNEDRNFILTTDSRQNLTHAQVKNFVCDGGVDLNSFGINAKSRVVFAVPNGPEAALGFLYLCARCVLAPLNQELSEHEIDFELEDLPADFIIVQQGSPHNSTIIACARRANVPVLELIADNQSCGLFSLRHLQEWETYKLPKLPSKTDFNPLGHQLLGLDDTCLLLHTSGTTLKPKIVPLTQRNLCTAAKCIDSTLCLQTSDVGMNIMPLFHLHGIMVNLLVPLVSGSAVVCTRGWSGSAAHFFSWAQDFNVTWYSAVPTMHLAITIYAEESLMRKGMFPEHKIQFARNCSAALPQSLAERMEAALGCSVLPTYAMSECVPICSNPRFGVRKLGSVGPPAGPSVMILDSGTNTLTQEPNVVGEVCVKGDCCITGYEMRPHMDPTMEMFRDGYLKTGDEGYFDDDGYLYLSGRRKELINRAGEKISPLLIENHVNKHPQICDSLVFACPHTELGETVGVVVIPKKGSDLPVLTLESVRSFMLNHHFIQSKWLPECFIAMDFIPKGPTGKPMRIKLADKLGLPEMSYKSDNVHSWVATKTLDGSWHLEIIESALADDAIEDSIALDAKSSEHAAIRECLLISKKLLCVEHLGADDVLLDAGLDSITAIVLLEKLGHTFQLDLASNTLELFPSSRTLGQYVYRMLQENNTQAEKLKSRCEYEIEYTSASKADNKTTPSLSHAERKALRKLKLENKVKAKYTKHESSTQPGTGLYHAKEGNLCELKDLVSQGWDPKVIVDKYGLTALQWAAGSGCLDVVKYLVNECEADIDQSNKEGRTPLMWACRNGHLDIALFLVQQGANIHAVTKKGVSSLHWATWGGSIECVDWLLGCGIPINLLSNAGCNCCVWASAAGRVDMCEYLLQKGADFEHLNNWGHGVVSKAAWHGHNEILKWLFKNANVLDQLFVINHVGEIPVELAEQAGHKTTVKLMLEYMEKEPAIFRPSGREMNVHQHKALKLKQ
eukprot:m.235480 g.235480  ORF g.235480 m.235480 type:complete len:983 (-) comp16046_c0_seq6:904-3852(-)